MVIPRGCETTGTVPVTVPVVRRAAGVLFRTGRTDEAIALANDNQYGLGSSIWTQNLSWTNQAIREIQAGVTWVNQIHYGYDELPFGGVKASGVGHEHGPEAVEYYQEKKGAVIGGLA